MHASRSETELIQHKSARAKETNVEGSTLNPLYKHAANADVIDEEKKSSQEEFKNHAIVYDFSLPNNAAPNEDHDTTSVCADPESKFQSDRSLLWSTPIIYSIVTLFSVIAVSYLMFLTSNTIVNKQCIELSNIACRKIRTVFQGSLSRQLDVVKQVASMIGRREGLFQE